MNNIEQDKKKSHPIRKTLAFIIGFIIIWYFLANGIETQSIQTMDDLKQKVAADFVEQYDIAKRQGDRVQICVQAGIVSAGFLQSKDEANYQKWKEIEKADCAKAGIRK